MKATLKTLSKNEINVERNHAIDWAKVEVFENEIEENGLDNIAPLLLAQLDTDLYTILDGHHRFEAIDRSTDWDQDFQAWVVSGEAIDLDQTRRFADLDFDIECGDVSYASLDIR